MINKLSEKEIDKELMDRDDRKPVRKVVDDYVAPATQFAVGAGAAVVGALGSLKTVDRSKTVQ